MSSMKVRKTIDVKGKRVLVAYFEKKKIQTVVHILEKRYDTIVALDNILSVNLAIPEKYKCSYGDMYDLHEDMPWKKFEIEESRESWETLMNKGFTISRLAMPWKGSEPLTRDENKWETACHYTATAGFNRGHVVTFNSLKTISLSDL